MNCPKCHKSDEVVSRNGQRYCLDCGEAFHVQHGAKGYRVHYKKTNKENLKPFIAKEIVSAYTAEDAVFQFCLEKEVEKKRITKVEPHEQT